MNLFRRLLLPGLSALMLASSATAAAPSQPNIIIFLIDDMGIMDTSVPFLAGPDGKPTEYPRNKVYRTPNMERLAKSGIRFGHFQAMSVCSPTRTSILTGQNPARHGTTNWINHSANNKGPYGPPAWNWKGIGKDQVTLSRLLNSAGYRTIHVGKAHFGPIGSPAEDPRAIGFDVNIAGCASGHPSSYSGKDNFAAKNNPKHPNNVPGLEKYHGKDIHLSEALTLEAIAEIDKAAVDGKPFFLNIAHYAVHTPFQVDPRFAANYPSLKEKNALAFATLIEGMDASLGQLLDHLEKSGKAENTLVFFLGDNGSDSPMGGAENVGSSAPLRGKKGSCYEGGVRVPFLASWVKPNPANPNQIRLPIASGGLQNQISSVEDIFPSLTRFLGTNPPDGYQVDGQDLSLLLTEQPDPARRKTFLMHYPHDHRSSYWSSLCLDDWKIIYRYHPDGGKPTAELYNLADDPFEAKNLAGEKPEELNRMIEELSDALNRAGAAGPVTKEGKVLTPVIP
ncbi:MAG: sulfatase [Verrucomicrobiales bacterium]